MVGLGFDLLLPLIGNDTLTQIPRRRMWIRKPYEMLNRVCCTQLLVVFCKSAVLMGDTGTTQRFSRLAAFEAGRLPMPPTRFREGSGLHNSNIL